MTLDEARERAMDIADQLTEIGPITIARFFSGAALRVDGVQFAFVIGGTPFFRVDEQSLPEFEAMGSGPFTYTGAKGLVTVAKYFEVPADVIENRELFVTWANRSRIAALAARSKSTRPRKNV